MTHGTKHEIDVEEEQGNSAPGIVRAVLQPRKVDQFLHNDSGPKRATRKLEPQGLPLKGRHRKDARVLVGLETWSPTVVLASSTNSKVMTIVNSSYRCSSSSEGELPTTASCHDRLRYTWIQAQTFPLPNISSAKEKLTKKMFDRHLVSRGHWGDRSHFWV